MPLKKVLIANRGEIAVRLVRACAALDVETVVAYAEPDRGSLAVQLADRSVCIGPARAQESYLNIPALISAARGVGADAVHPGYGFLSENAEFALRCSEEGLVFVGPRSDTIRGMGDKLEARATATKLGLALLPGSDGIATLADAKRVAREIGFPLLIKAAAGGGGRGIRLVRDSAELPAALQSAAAEAEAAFGSRELFIERYVEKARHVEVQVFGDRFGNTVHLGDRDCTLQRRYQKIVEEAPAPFLPHHVRLAMHDSALRLAVGIGYENAGTVEFVYDAQREEFYFLEMNTRIQVEHPVTECVTGIDLVQWQLLVAGGAPLPLTQDQIVVQGHAVECRLGAEDPNQGFLPSPGRIDVWELPHDDDSVRVDTHCFRGYIVPAYYDSLLAKIITYGTDRPSALTAMMAALDRSRVEGIHTTLPMLRRLVASPDFLSLNVWTTWVDQLTTAERF